jgi:hypothetical protein
LTKKGFSFPSLPQHRQFRKSRVRAVSVFKQKSNAFLDHIRVIQSD